MYAIINDGSRQLRVQKGETHPFDLRSKKKDGESIEFHKVVAIGEEGGLTLGTPTVKNARVVGEVVSRIKGEKVRVFKYRRRKGWHRTRGHRQQYTLVKITDIHSG
jgi:large subunit ribosomal protein L21